MPDVVVTVPRRQWQYWLREGDLAGSPYTGRFYEFSVGIHPRIEPGERVYIVARGKLRGWAPLIRVEESERGVFLIRGGDAVAVTLPQPVKGFRGFRYRWWQRDWEEPFPAWKVP